MFNPDVHKDYFGKEIKVGDYVVYSVHGGYAGFSGVFVVESFTPKKLRVMKIGNPTVLERPHYRGNTSIFPETCLIVSDRYSKEFPNP